MEELPNWVKNYNDSLKLNTYKDSIWVKSLNEKLYVNYSREDFFEGESDNFKSTPYSPVFPIGIENTDDLNSVLMGFPWFEREILNLAEKAIVNEKLGQRDEPDLIFIGLSAMDWIIHDYGPFSQEVMDAFVKLDKYLMNFIKNVDNILGLENVLFTLTADHGGLPLPEYIVKNGGSGGRIKKDHLKEALQWIDQESEELYGNNLYHRDESNFYLNYKSLKDKNVDTVELFKIVEKYLLRVEGVREVIKKDNILKSEYNNDKIKTRIKNMIHHDYSPDFFVILKKGIFIEVHMEHLMVHPMIMIHMYH